MLKKIIFITALTFTLLSKANAQQENKSTLFEYTVDSLVRFYYDENYYLVDKHCEFKAIERIARFIPKTYEFNGAFKDFNNAGRLILEGTYVNGKKEGIFKAYHPNGALKWETVFKNDNISGHWKYYYPDEKPMLFLSIKDSLIHFDQFWQNDGEQTIINGEGKYNMTIPIIGFTDHGYTQYNVSGNVKNGRQDGQWKTQFVKEDKKNSLVPLFTENFENGLLTNRPTSNFVSFYSLDAKIENFDFVPTSHFLRAQQLVAKGCTFDEHTNFDNFLARKFTYLLHSPELINYDFSSIPTSYKVRVYKDGVPNRIFANTYPIDLDKSIKRIINESVEKVTYYLPFLMEKPLAMY